MHECCPYSCHLCHKSEHEEEGWTMIHTDDDKTYYSFEKEEN